MLFSLLAVAALAGPEIAAEAAELKTDSGTLFGTLDLPAGKGPFPVVLIHAGSGPTDRDGNQAKMKNDSLKLLGQALAAKGIACLRIDKRGIAASAKAMGREEDLRLDNYVADTVQWVEWLRKDKRFTKVGLLGHSEGALIVALAAKPAKADAVVELCGMGRPFGVILREQLKKNLPAHLMEKSDAILTALEAGKEAKEIPTELAALYRPSVQPYLMSVLKRDPVEAIQELKCPILVLSGTTDIQVAEADAKALTGARVGVKSVRLENMNHVLKEIDTTDRLAQILRTYVDPTPPLHPKLVDAIADFLSDK
jgi:fermentation-respiration switch protein FrsA (DUF1100 family)